MLDSKLDALMRSFGEERRTGPFTLERFSEALREAGDPQKKTRTFVVGGTNGKGSTALYFSSILAAAGHRVGTYLSPHLQHLEERFLVDLVQEDSEVLATIGAEYLPLAQRCGISYFEFLTLIAFVWAKRQQLDFLVLEVGLGGRLDATNVTHPLACAITTIGFDHEALLGNSLEAILNEKMGILREESLVFSGLREPRLKAQLESRCAELDAVYYYSDELRVESVARTWKGQRVAINGYEFALHNPTPAAAQNAALAVLMARIIFPKIGLPTIQSALSRVASPGRFEEISHSPHVLLSGDHNPEGVASLIDGLQALRANKTGKIHTLCAFSPDKQHRALFEALKRESDSILLTQVPRFHATLPPSYFELGDYEADPDRALDRVLSRIDSPQDTVVVTGSLYLVGHLRPRWQKRVQFLKDGPPVL